MRASASRSKLATTTPSLVAAELRHLVAAVVGDERRPVEALPVLLADAVRRDDGDDVGHGVPDHRALPGVARVEVGLVRLAADGRRVEEHLGAEEHHGARRLGEPLVPADADAERAVAASTTRGSRCRRGGSRTSPRSRGRRGCGSCGRCRAPRRRRRRRRRCCSRPAPPARRRRPGCTTPSSRATTRIRATASSSSSARACAKCSAFSSRQKYGPSKSSGGRITCAPRAAAARTCPSTRARFSARAPPRGHWMAATVTLRPLTASPAAAAA